MQIVILTGAGISAESGVSTFRDPDGVWSKFDYREVATPEGFAADPQKVHGFYNARRAGLGSVDPNPAHIALAKLEAALTEHGHGFTLITQNVDDLHARAGSKTILQMHGALARIRCDHCAAVRPWAEDLSTDVVCDGCGLPGGLRPDVVWFGEIPRHMEEIDAAMAEATHFVSIGTSGTVYPAAGLVAIARDLGVRTVEINLEPSANADLFDETHYGPAAKAVPNWCDSIIAQIQQEAT